MRTYVVYALRDRDDAQGTVRYVGQSASKRGLAERLYQHKWAARTQATPKHPVTRWIKKIGPERVHAEVLEECEDSESLDEAEVRWIAFYRAQGEANLNIRSGGYGNRPEDVSGELNSRSVLSWPQVRGIRKRATECYIPRTSLAMEFGVTPATVSKILLNRSWIDPKFDPSEVVTGSPHRKFSDSEVEEIRQRFLETGSVALTQEEFGLSHTTTHRVLFRAYGSEESRSRCRSLPGRVTRPTQARLRAEDIPRIRALLAQGTPQKVVATQYGVSQGSISNIARGKTWGQVE